MREKKVEKKYSIKGHGINPQRFDKSQIKFFAYLIPIGIIMALPIIFIFMNAFKPLDELFAYPPRFYVRNPTFQNFIALFKMSSETNIPASRYLFNSIISTVITVILMIFVSISAAYVFSKKKGKAIKIFFTINNLALMFVTIAVAIPRYFVVSYMGLLDNFLAHIIPLLASPVGVFLLKQFIDEIPDALIEAAIIDGANDFQILFKIIFKLAKPAIATLTIVAFQASWNAVEASTYYINNESIKSFSFYLSTLSSQATVSGQGISAAATLIMFLPNLILFIIMQSKVMNTMTHSGIK